VPTLDQLKAQGKDLRLRVENFSAIENDRTLSESQKQHAWSVLKKDYDEWEAAYERQEAIETKAVSDPKIQKLMAGGAGGASATHNDLGTKQMEYENFEEMARHEPLDGTIIPTRGCDISPFVKGSREARDRIDAAIRRSAGEGADASSGSFRMKAFTGAETKSFTTASSLVPPDLSLPIQERLYDVRVLDMLPVITGSGSVFRYVMDPSTTGVTAATTAEGALKPELDIDYTDTDTTYTKGAVFIRLSYETISDYPTSLSASITRAMNDLMSWENSQLLNGTGASGSNPGMVGLNNVSGIGTLAIPDSLPTGATNIDYFTVARDSMRTSPGVFAEPDIAIMHPTTFHSLCLEKDSLGRYLLNPSPGVDTADRIVGIPVRLTTDQTEGVATLIDTKKYGYAVVREGVIVYGPDHSGTDFQQNLRSWAVETRLTSIVIRPGAVFTITNLPTSVTP
jgi:HK97 family phage major capsid protein